MSTTLVCLNVVHTGQTGPTGHHWCSLGQSSHFGGSHAIGTQSFENSQKLVFCRTLDADLTDERISLPEWRQRVFDSVIRRLSSRTAVTLSPTPVRTN
jgi:hypothetical protein